MASVIAAVVIEAVLTMVTGVTNVHAAAVSYASAARFLQQATFGPTAADIANLQQIGFSQWFAMQQAAGESTFPAPGLTDDTSLERQAFLYNAMNGPDQLRQRMAFALGQIWVVSGLKLPVDAMQSYLQLLQDNAFANYRTVMQNLTLSPSMGRYLDMVNNAKANPATDTLPNENFAREFMQLFTIGMVVLNPDGTPKLDSIGHPIPLYGQSDIQTLARVFTGWTFPTQPGQTAKPYNPQYFVGPMIPSETIHDTGAKVIFGHTLPAGQTAEQDLAQTIDIIFNHPNLPPFVSLRLIQHFVTSNPSPDYVRRVSMRFINNGHGVRGDLYAVINAILLDPGARQGDNDVAMQPPTGGHLLEPVIYATEVLRALGATVAATNSLAMPIGAMGQQLLLPASVFNYYSPFYQIPDTALAGPEFQLLTPSTALIRANFIYAVLENHVATGVTVDLTPYVKVAGDSNQLLSAVDKAFTRGQMPSTMQGYLLTAINASSDPATRAQTAVYLAATSGFYQLEH
jgi:uncharacterized protein (DUF1800 family)